MADASKIWRDIPYLANYDKDIDSWIEDFKNVIEIYNIEEPNRVFVWVKNAVEADIKNHLKSKRKSKNNSIKTSPYTKEIKKKLIDNPVPIITSAMKKNTIMKRKSNVNNLANTGTSNMIIDEERTNVKTSTNKNEDMEFKESKDPKNVSFNESIENFEDLQPPNNQTITTNNTNKLEYLDLSSINQPSIRNVKKVNKLNKINEILSSSKDDYPLTLKVFQSQRNT